MNPLTVSVVEINPTLDSSDQEVFAFDDGSGQITGVGVTSGNIDYASGTLTIQFDTPPPAAFPINISYSRGATPLTTGQLRGLLTFQTKGKCISCHGGPGALKRVGWQRLSSAAGADDHGRFQRARV